MTAELLEKELNEVFGGQRAWGPNNVYKLGDLRKPDNKCGSFGFKGYRYNEV